MFVRKFDNRSKASRLDTEIYVAGSGNEIEGSVFLQVPNLLYRAQLKYKTVSDKCIFRLRLRLPRGT